MHIPRYKAALNKYGKIDPWTFIKPSIFVIIASFGFMTLDWFSSIGKSMTVAGFENIMIPKTKKTTAMCSYWMSRILK